MTAVQWRRLRESGSGAVVLAVDFGAGRTEAGFADLAPHLDGDYGLWETLFTAPAGSPDWCAESDPDRWADAVSDQLDRDGVHVCGILAYCAGAALAFTLARRSAARGRAPGVILLDPETAEVRAVEEFFQRSFRGWREYAGPGTLDAAAPERVRQAAARAERMGQQDTAHYVPLLEVVCGEYDAACAALGKSLGLDSEVIDDMSGRARAFLTYLVTSARVAPPDLSAMAQQHSHVTLVSAEHTIPEFVSGETVRFPAARDHLLESKEVAAQVDRRLRQG